MGWQEWKDKIKTWLETEDIDSDRVVDDKWDVEEKDERLFAKTYRIPFTLIIEYQAEEVEEGSSYISLILETDFNTSKLETYEMVYVYRKMLKMHTQSQLVKYCLGGEIRDEPIIRTDLDLASLNKKEFEDALQNTISGADRFFSSVIPEKELEKITGFGWDWELYTTYHMMRSLMGEIEAEKISSEEAKNRLISKFKMEREDAADILKSALMPYVMEKIQKGEIDTFSKAVNKIVKMVDSYGEEEASKTFRAYLQDWLMDNIDHDEMSSEEAIYWLMKNIDMNKSEAYSLLNEEKEKEVDGIEDIWYN